MSRKVLVLCLVLVLLSACRAPATPTVPPATTTPAATPLPLTATPEPTATATVTPTSTPTLTPTPAPLRVAFDAAVTPGLRERVLEALGDQRTQLVDDGEVTDLRVGPEAGSTWGAWVYAAVVPFPTLADEVSFEQIRAFWSGDAVALSHLTGDGTNPTLYATTDVLAALEKLLGPRSDDTPVQLIERDAWVDAAWEARPHAWAVVPFDELEPRWKLLRVDGAALWDKALDLAGYPLALDMGLQAAKGVDAAETLASVTMTNRDVSRITTLIMTGCTALVRATAFEMEQRGVLYPAEKVGDLLRSADITHISNEIPFAKNCPYPDRNQQELVFCSDPKYIELLRAVSTDVVELTGNHFQDWGSQATLDTLEMYREEGWPWFGGGADLADASKAITLESDGNSFSFIGCNPVGPIYAWATEDRPGAAPCDWEYMHGELARLKQQVDVPIATFQYWEHYQYAPTEQQQVDFRGMVDAGAAIVSGSQSHHPQGFEFYNGGFIHYGPGNLFFDQMWSLGTRQQVIDRHVIYDGRHISTELNTYMLENYAQPRPMTEAERVELLTALFEASGW